MSDYELWSIDSGRFNGGVRVRPKDGRITSAPPCYKWMVGEKLELIQKLHTDWQFEKVATYADSDV